MINIRSLFNKRRYADCENPRQSIGVFAEVVRSSLSLFCEETEDANLRLMINDMGSIVPAADYPLPDYIHERISCWNNWASYTIENEWENPTSPYGLEVYGASIAINISSVCKEHLVDWCGLPVHDDYALLSHSMQLAEERRSVKEYPSGMVDNRYISELQHAAAMEFGEVPKRSLHYLLYDAYDEGRLYYYDRVKAPCGTDDWKVLWEHMFDVTTTDGFPEWLEKEASYCGEIYGCDCHREYLYWDCCRLLFNFRLAAVGIDVMRYLHAPMPVVTSHLYIAQPENFPSDVMRPTVKL